MITPNGLPGLMAGRDSTPRRVWLGSGALYLPGGRVIKGSTSRDSGSTGSTDVLRAGILMGKTTSDGFYAPSIIGVTTDAVLSGATTVTVSAAQAVELVRRVGATGTLRFVGPPGAAGVVATFTETYSAVNVTTGAITCAATDAALIAGTFVCANDGTHLPISFISEEWGMKVTDEDAASINTPWAELPIGGVVDSAQLINWPSDTSLRAWIVASLNVSGRFQFNHLY